MAERSSREEEGPSPFRVLLLAAGYGTRLGRQGRHVPKALLPLGGRPLVDHLLDDLWGSPRLRQVIVVTNGRFASAMQAWADENHARASVPIQVLNDGTLGPDERLGAVGDLAFALAHTGLRDNLLVLASDTLPGFSLQTFVEAFSCRPGADLLLPIREAGEREPLTNRGIVSLDPDDRVQRFQEKPQDPASRLTALPLYLFRSRTLPLVRTYLDGGGERDAPGHLVEWLTPRVRVEGWRAPAGRREDVGTPEGYAEAQRRFRGGRGA